MEWVSTFVSIVVETVTGLLGGLGKGIVGFFEDLFIDSSGTTNTITSLGAFIIVLLGVSIALGAVSWVSTLIRGRR